MLTVKALPQVLCYGRDEALLITRRFLIQTLGIECITANDRSGYLISIVQNPVGLIVLCHSLTAEDRSEALALAQQYRPLSEVLLLCSSIAKSTPASGPLAFHTTEGPDAFLRTVRYLLHLV